jgi:Bacterial Ig domain
VERESKNSTVKYCTEGACRQALFSGASVLCDNKDYFGTEVTCDEIVAANSAVSCEAGACLNAKFTDSTVTCQKTRGGPSCLTSSMTRSTVTCLDESCTTTTFAASAVTCDYFDSCKEATFDNCTCCDGYGCPDGIVSCQGDLVTLCASCAGHGHPLCGEMNGINSVPMQTPPSSVAVPTLMPIIPMSPSPVVIPAVSNPTQMPSANLDETMAPIVVREPMSRSPVLPGTNEVANGTAFSAAANTPVEIPPIASGNETATITKGPENGNITVKDDGTLTYTPNQGFEGVDHVSVMVCDSENACEVIVLSVTIGRPGNSNDSSLYWLALLALLPLGAIVGYCIHGPHSSKTAKVEATQSLTINLQQPLQVGHVVDQEAPDEGEAYSSPIQEPQPSSAADMGDRLSDVSPPAPAKVAVGILPDNKDQCRSFADPLQPTPLATAVVVNNDADGVDRSSLF